MDDENDNPLMYCRKCRYDLRKLEAGECPECGRSFDPADQRTFDKSTSDSLWFKGAYIGMAFGFCFAANLLALMAILAHGLNQEPVSLIDTVEPVASFVAAPIIRWSKAAQISMLLPTIVVSAVETGLLWSLVTLGRKLRSSD